MSTVLSPRDAIRKRLLIARPARRTSRTDKRVAPFVACFAIFQAVFFPLCPLPCFPCSLPYRSSRVDRNVHLLFLIGAAKGTLHCSVVALFARVQFDESMASFAVKHIQHRNIKREIERERDTLSYNTDKEPEHRRMNVRVDGRTND